MDFQLAHNLVASYKRLSYKAWYALAEFVDNSTQAYFNNKEVMDRQLLLEYTTLKIVIEYDRDQDMIRITDNSIGMNYEELSKAMTLGSKPDIDDGRSQYGLGMKTAACWFGNNWHIKTSKLGDSKGYRIDVNVDKVANGETDLPEEEYSEDADSHYTIIEINDLNSKLRTRTISKIRQYLRSIYRFDFEDYSLQLYWQDELLTWESLKDNLYITEDGEPFFTEFEFKVDGKPVHGWVGVLGKGYSSRQNAGFSIIQARRVIQGLPGGYKPATIFGDQDDGRNDLVNQRVTGEIFLDGFAVSHTKDEILFQGNEEDELENKLKEVSEEAVYLARNIRFSKENISKNEILKGYTQTAVSSLEKELQSDVVNDYVATVEPPPENIIAKSYKRVEESITSDNDTYLEAKIGKGRNIITVNIFFSSNSEFEPYAIIELNPKKDYLNIIINSLHPYFTEFESPDMILNFVRHCVYDGVSEWKAIKLIGDIKPNTVKFIKDGLLRLPFEIKKEIKPKRK